MALQLLTFLIFFPLAVAAVVVFNRKAEQLPYIIHPASAILIGSSYLLLGFIVSGKTVMVAAHAGWVEPMMLVAECVLAAYLLFLAAKRRDTVVSVFLIVQTAMLVRFHFGAGQHVHAAANLFVDNFSVIMGLIVGVLGTLIAVFGVGYMKDFHHHHPEVPDNRSAFFGLIFLFLSAMFGVCFSNNLMWLFFFWEITTVCSFLLIRYKGDEQSVQNAFWALRWNLLGGLAFLVGIIYLYQATGTIELDKMLLAPKLLVMLPVALISFAGMTKSAQLPFSSWLVGAMVAPTPVSALLHSSTMVKAGVYIVLRFASVMEGTLVGLVVAIIGVLTFLIGSFVCISQSDGKKVLAYSTIANLGLIIMCAGVGTAEAVWAALLLIIFHAVSKGLLFLCVGAIENRIGSRNIEDMTGLIVRMPKLSVIFQIGIAGMFLAPFGMLISKWVVLRAIVDFNPLLAIFLIFGSAATLYYWVKWIGKLLIIDRDYDNVEHGISRDQWLPMASMAGMTVFLCAFFAPVGYIFIEPYIEAVFGQPVYLGTGSVIIMGIMLALLALFPLSFLGHSHAVRLKAPYLAGVNVGEAGRHFRDSLGGVKDMEMRNYYLEDYFSEKRLMRLGILLATTLAVALVLFGGI